MRESDTCCQGEETQSRPARIEGGRGADGANSDTSSADVQEITGPLLAGVEMVLIVQLRTPRYRGKKHNPELPPCDAGGGAKVRVWTGPHRGGAGAQRGHHAAKWHKIQASTTPIGEGSVQRAQTGTPQLPEGSTIRTPPGEGGVGQMVLIRNPFGIPSPGGRYNTIQPTSSRMETCANCAMRTPPQPRK